MARQPTLPQTLTAAAVSGAGAFAGLLIALRFVRSDSADIGALPIWILLIAVGLVVGVMIVRQRDSRHVLTYRRQAVVASLGAALFSLAAIGLSGQMSTSGESGFDGVVTIVGLLALPALLAALGILRCIAVIRR